MLSRTAKASFFVIAAPMMRINGALYRAMRAPRSGAKAHLGPGRKRYLPGWINVDANMFTGKCDVWTDLRYELPFLDNSLHAVYSHHVVEHLPNIRAHFHDIFRCLEAGGIYRVGGPNGDSAIRKFVENDKSWFSHFPEDRRSIGGRFENFIFCGREHLTILTESFLRELLEDAGFVDVTLRKPIVDSGYPELFADALEQEHESDMDCPHTLLLEAAKPI
ncbi:methyltransferase [Roseovarius sp. TE539]|uniref:class I SAM-dependent methyltransferase n=1 Tax=Roseovarius sp. TE539 TaxID=2249812 RepID=UPI000DE1941C|nr:methyltransferase domain-containing protein [Roseovarius sp. TE539]RBI69004.1 methyltransferase [Roseovarius sp. TE539]